MAVSTPYARSYFRQLWADAQAAGQTLLYKLQTLNSAAIAATASGQVIQSTSGNGRSVTFAVDNGNTKAPSTNISPTDIVELLDRLNNFYDAAVADGETTDSGRYAWIMERLQPIRAVRSNYMVQLSR